MKVIRLVRGWQAISQIYFFPALNAINYSDISRVVYWVKSLYQSNAVCTDSWLASIMQQTAERINKSNTTRLPTWLTEWSALHWRPLPTSKLQVIIQRLSYIFCFSKISLICFSHLSKHVASHRCVATSFWNVTLQFSDADSWFERHLWEICSLLQCWNVL